MIKKLIKTNSPIVICDIGASAIDPTPFIDDLISNTDTYLFGFEPNKREFEKLIESEKKKYFNYAVGDGKEQILNICSSPGMTSILEPDFNYLNLFHGFSDWAKIENKEKIKTKKLDEIDFKKKIDFIKIDVQGYEYEVIMNGKDVLRDCLVIQLETSPTPLYKNEKTFAELSLELEKLGFNLHCFNKINTRCFKPMTLQNNIYNGLNHLFQLDCVFVKKLNYIQNADLEELKKLALILFYSFKSYDVVDYIISIISKSDQKKLIDDYRNIMKSIKIFKKY